MVKRLMDTGAAMRWNSLPNELKCAITTNCFKKTIKTYLFNSRKLISDSMCTK